MYAGIAVAKSRKSVSFRPPILSVKIPAGNRHMDPLSTATAETHESC